MKSIFITIFIALIPMLGFSQDYVSMGKKSGSDINGFTVPEGEVWSITSMSNYSSVSITNLTGSTIINPYYENQSLIEVKPDDCVSFFVSLPIIITPGTTILVSCLSNSYVTIRKTK